MKCFTPIPSISSCNLYLGCVCSEARWAGREEPVLCSTGQLRILSTSVSWFWSNSFCIVPCCLCVPRLSVPLGVCIDPQWLLFLWLRQCNEHPAMPLIRIISLIMAFSTELLCWSRSSFAVAQFCLYGFCCSLILNKIINILREWEHFLKYGTEFSTLNLFSRCLLTSWWNMWPLELNKTSGFSSHD